MIAKTLSVIIPNYNHAYYLEGALNTMCNQSYTPKEIIIIDDGSTDNRLSIIESFSRNYQNVHVLKNIQNKGVTFSMNKGLKYASGDYVYFGAVDDRISPEPFRDFQSCPR